MFFDPAMAFKMTVRRRWAPGHQRRARHLRRPAARAAARHHDPVAPERLNREAGANLCRQRTKIRASTPGRASCPPRISSSTPASCSTPTAPSRPIPPWRRSAWPSAPRAIAARPSTRSFNEAHVLAISQAICHYRQQAGIDGPLFIGIDTHALSQPAFESALEVLAANGVEVMISRGRRIHADAGGVARDPRLQPRPHAAGWPTASSSRRRTTRRKTAASSTTRRTAARPTATSPAGSRKRPIACWPSGLKGVKRMPYRAGPAGRDHARARFPRAPTSPISAA